MSIITRAIDINGTTSKLCMTEDGKLFISGYDTPESYDINNRSNIDLESIEGEELTAEKVAELKKQVSESTDGFIKCNMLYVEMFCESTDESKSMGKGPELGEKHPGSMWIVPGVLVIPEIKDVSTLVDNRFDECLGHLVFIANPQDRCPLVDMNTRDEMFNFICEDMDSPYSEVFDMEPTSDFLSVNNTSEEIVRGEKEYLHFYGIVSDFKGDERVFYHVDGKESK